MRSCSALRSPTWAAFSRSGSVTLPDDLHTVEAPTSRANSIAPIVLRSAALADRGIGIAQADVPVAGHVDVVDGQFVTIAGLLDFVAS